MSMNMIAKDGQPLIEEKGGMGLLGLGIDDAGLSNFPLASYRFYDDNVYTSFYSKFIFYFENFCIDSASDPFILKIEFEFRTLFFSNVKA